MTIVLDGSGLTIEKLVRVARDNEKVELHPNALKRVETCREMLERKIKAKEIIYSGQPINAYEAYRIGLVNHIYNNKEIDSKVLHIAEILKKNSTRAIKE